MEFDSSPIPFRLGTPQYLRQQIMRDTPNMTTLSPGEVEYDRGVFLQAVKHVCICVYFKATELTFSIS